MKAILMLLVVTFPLAASAQGPDRARQHFQRGEVHYRLGEFARALDEFRAALKLTRRSSIVLNLAQSYRQLDRPKKALFYYKLYLDMYDRENPGKESPYLQDVQKFIGWCVARQEQLRRDSRPKPGPGSAASGTLSVKVPLPGARVELDGEEVGRGPLATSLDVKPGRRLVQASRFGFGTRSRRFQMKPAGRARVELELRRNRFWFFTGLAAAALAVTAETTAVVCTLEARDQYQGLPTWERYRNGALAGHIVAGTLAAAAAVSFYLHVRNGRLERQQWGTSAGYAPAKGGGVAVGRVSF